MAYTGPRTIDRAAWRFFHEHAGYVVGRRAIGAAALARAERAVTGRRVTA